MLAKEVNYEMVDEEKARQAGREIREWLSTPEGRACLDSFLKSGTPVADAVAGARDIDPSDIWEQIGPRAPFEDE